MQVNAAHVTDGEVRAGGKSVPLRDAAKSGEIVAEDSIEFGELSKQYQQSTFGAHFVEVAVDMASGECRLRRMLAVCAAGRILNPISANWMVADPAKAWFGWPDNPKIEALRAAAPGVFVAVHHIGSTAVPGLMAKPVIDLLGEADVTLRIQPFETGTEHRDGLAAGVQRALMRRTINAQRQPAGDDEAGTGQAAGERSGIVQAIARGAAAADHRQLGSLEQAGIAGNEQ